MVCQRLVQHLLLFRSRFSCCQTPIGSPLFSFNRMVCCGVPSVTDVLAVLLDLLQHPGRHFSQTGLRLIQPGADFVPTKHVGNRCSDTLEKVQLALSKLCAGRTDRSEARGHSIEQHSEWCEEQLHPHPGVIDVLAKVPEPGCAVTGQLLEVNRTKLPRELLYFLDALNKRTAQGFSKVLKGAVLIHPIYLISQA